MKSIVFFIVCVYSVVTYAQGQFETGNQLKADCDSPTGSFRESYCFGYIIGAADSYNLLYCAPNGVTKGQLLSIVKKYLNDNPAQLHRGADLLVKNALQNALPCPKGK